MLLSFRFLLLALLLSTVFTLQAKPVLLHNIQLVDVERGTLVPDQMVLIEKNRISAVLPVSRLTEYSAATLVDGQGRYLIPALWDMHVHFEGRDLIEDNALLLPVYLAYGITAVREAASNLAPVVLKWRSEVANGERLGPRIFTAGQKFEGVGSIWDGDLEIANEQDMLAGMDMLQQQQVDFIKITENALAADLYLKTIKEARRRGMLVSSHVPYSTSIAELADAGLSSIEHASYLLRLGFADEQTVATAVRQGKMSNADASAHYADGFDQQQALAGYKMLAEKQVAVTPTLIGGRQLAHLADTDHSHDSFLQYLTPQFTDNYQWRINRMADETAEQSAARKQRYQLIASQLPYLQQAGVLLLAGSDSAALNTYVYPAQALHDEMELFQQAGLTPAQILQSATLNGARFMQLEQDYGSITAGKMADLVLLQQNPLQDISAVRQPAMLIYQGTVYDRQQLDALLKKAAERRQQLTGQHR